MTPRRLAAPDPRPTADIVRGARLRETAAAFRQAAAELLERADEMEREARDGMELANVIAEADRELNGDARRRRAS